MKHLQNNTAPGDATAPFATGRTDRRTFLARCALGAAGAWLAAPRLFAADTGLKLDNPFFAYSMEFNKDHPLENAPADLKKLGYDGTALSSMQAFPRQLEAYRAEGLQVFAVYVLNGVKESTTPPPYFLNAVKALEGTGVALWCAIGGGTFDQMADRAVTFVREAADIAADSGVTLVLYPHAHYCPAIASEAVELIRRAERPAVRVTLNLVHDGAGRLAAKGPEIIAEVLPYLHIATINGTAGISPLGTGSFDTFAFLKQLKEAGYDGPIGLQTYGIKAPPIEHLAQSMQAWRGYQERMAANLP